MHFKIMIVIHLAASDNTV